MGIKIFAYTFAAVLFLQAALHVLDEAIGGHIAWSIVWSYVAVATIALAIWLHRIFSEVEGYAND